MAQDQNTGQYFLHDNFTKSHRWHHLIFGSSSAASEPPSAPDEQQELLTTADCERYIRELGFLLNSADWETAEDANIFFMTTSPKVIAGTTLFLEV